MFEERIFEFLVQFVKRIGSILDLFFDCFILSFAFLFLYIHFRPLQRYFSLNWVRAWRSSLFFICIHFQWVNCFFKVTLTVECILFYVNFDFDSLAFLLRELFFKLIIDCFKSSFISSESCLVLNHLATVFKNILIYESKSWLVV